MKIAQILLLRLCLWKAYGVTCKGLLLLINMSSIEFSGMHQFGGLVCAPKYNSLPVRNHCLPCAGVTMEQNFGLCASSTLIASGNAFRKKNTCILVKKPLGLVCIHGGMLFTIDPNCYESVVHTAFI